LEEESIGGSDCAGEDLAAENVDDPQYTDVSLGDEGEPRRGIFVEAANRGHVLVHDVEDEIKCDGRGDEGASGAGDDVEGLVDNRREERMCSGSSSMGVGAASRSAVTLRARSRPLFRLRWRTELVSGLFRVGSRGVDGLVWGVGFHEKNVCG
jgi:hypothetical protein